MNEQTYYCVTSTFHDIGRVTAAITMTQICSVKPESHMTSTRDRDIYTDWYDNFADAQKAVAEARAESSC